LPERAFADSLNIVEFNPDSLKKFIETPRGRQIPDEETQRPSGAKTNRGDRVTQMLKGGASGAPGGKFGPEAVDPVMRFDAAIRSNLAELVRNLLQQGKTEKLGELLQDHKQFIDSILGLLNNKEG